MLEYARRLLAEPVIECPHPEMRAAQRIWVPCDRRSLRQWARLIRRRPRLALRSLLSRRPSVMLLCGLCARELELLAGEPDSSRISRVMVRLGYSEDDAAEFASDAGAI